jgi:phage portal protein BeeE
MDFISTLKECSKYIAMAYGVPLPLIDNDASTFNNLKEAKEKLYIDTVIPLFNQFLSQLNIWLSKQLNGNYICIDLDDVPALESLRQVKFDRVTKAVDLGIISIDEARIELDFAPRGGVHDQILVNQGKIPLDLVGFTDFSQEEQDTAMALKHGGFSDKEIKQMVISDRDSCSHK